MYLKVELPWTIEVPPRSLDKEGVKFQTEIVRRLLKEFSAKRATKDLGYFLAVTTLDSIGEGKVRPDTGDVTFPISFSCITFKLFTGEIIDAVVYKVMKHGICLRCGPVENVFLSANKMPGYRYIPREDDPVFLNYEKPHARIRKDVTIRCVVIGTRWIEGEREFCVVVDLPDENI